MLSKLRVQHYKSLFDTQIDLEPLTVFIGSNGSGKSNICEALAVLSDFLQRLVTPTNVINVMPLFADCLTRGSNNQQNFASKFWQGKLDSLLFEVSTYPKNESIPSQSNTIFSDLFVYLDYPRQQVEISNRKKTDGRISPFTGKLSKFLISNQYLDSSVAKALRKLSFYDFTPIYLYNKGLSPSSMNRTGQGIVYALVDILHADRKKFDELEER